MPRFLRIHGPEAGALLDRLQIDELPKPQPKDDEICIRVEGFALNYGDFGLMQGDYPFTIDFPSTFGDEASGVVDAIGPDANRFKIGDKVATLPWMNEGYGVNGEYALVPEYYVETYPDNLSADEGAAIWVQYLTAYYGLYTAARIKTDDVVLNCAASSAAGIAATQLAKLCGTTVIGTTRGTDNVDFIRETGADHVIVTGCEDVSARIRELTGGEGVRVIYDPVGGLLTAQYAGALASGAIVLLYGSLSGQPTVVPLNEMINAAAIMQPHSVYNYIKDRALKAEGVRFIQDALKDGRIKPLIDRTFPLDDFRDAFAYQLAAKNRRGKIIINP